MYATPKRSVGSGSTPLMEFSPNLSPISMIDASIPFNADQTPDRPHQSSTPPSSHFNRAMRPFLPGIAEEVDSNASFADRSIKPTNLDNTLLHSMSLLDNTPQRPPLTPPIRSRAANQAAKQSSERTAAAPNPPPPPPPAPAPDDGPTQATYGSRETGYDRNANRALLQSVAESHRRWRNDTVENLLRSSAHRQASSPDAPNPTAKTPTAPSSTITVLTTPTPVIIEPSGSAAQPPATPISTPNLPVGSLYALVLDNSSNPVLVPIRSSSPPMANRQPSRHGSLAASAPFGLGQESQPAVSSGSSHAKVSFGSVRHSSHHSSSPPLASAMAGAGAAFASSPSPSSSSPHRMAAADDVHSQGFLRHAMHHRSFTHLETQVMRELRDSRERLDARPLEVAQDAEFHAAYQNFYTPRKGSAGSPSLLRPLPEWDRLLQPEKRLRASVPQYSSPSQVQGTIRTQSDKSQLWESADADQRKESRQYQFWKERIAQRNTMLSLQTSTP